ncbi:MAG: hypothetical protein R2707_20345 [Acidimicrobiales bacterium]
MIERLRGQPEKLNGWLAFIVWVVQPFTLGPLLGEALDPTRDLFRTACSWALWLGWLEVLVALALPRPITLTVTRIGATATVPMAVWAAVGTDETTLTVVGLLSAIAAAGVVLAPTFADRFIDGVSYGEERRFALRPPGPVLVGLLVPTWAVVVAGACAGPLLLADEQWVLGGILTVVGWPPAVLGARALHQLTNRFVVFVPNGFVVHDLTVMREPVLFQSREIAGLAPALADTAADDMTGAALGLALELKLAAPATLPMVAGRKETEDRDVRALLIAPSRPAAVMTLAQTRGFRIV